MTSIRKLAAVTIPALALGCATIAFASGFCTDTASDLPSPSGLLVAGADLNPGSAQSTGVNEPGAVVMNMWQQTSSSPRTIRWW